MDDEQWAVRYLVVRTGGFFDGRSVLISPISFREVDWSAREFHIALTIKMMKGSPDIDADTSPTSSPTMRPEVCST